MLYYYSAVKNAFFPDELKDAYQDAGNWPQDAAEVEESVFTTYSASPPQGKQRAADKDGLPCWVDISLPDIEDARSQKHTEINAWRSSQENASYIFTFNSQPPMGLRQNHSGAPYAIGTDGKSQQTTSRLYLDGRR